MTWEYQIEAFEDFADIADVTKILNNLGQGGWELVSVPAAGDNAKLFIFKRPGRHRE